MATYKNIRIKKKGGGTRLQRVQVLKSGKYRFVKNKGTASKRKASSRTKTKKRRKTMARRKKRRTSRKLTIPISLAAPVVVTFTRRMPSGRSLLSDITSGRWDNLGYDLQELIGIQATDGKFNAGYLASTLMPFVGGWILHKAATYLGINRWMARNKIPLIRI